MFTTIATRRFQQRLPQDSGEWQAVPLKFRRLKQPPAVPHAQLISATLVALVVHLALLGLAAARISEAWAVVLPVGAISAAAGVTWLAQFRPVDGTRAARLGVLWAVAGGLLPALMFPELLGLSIAALLFQAGWGAVGGSVAQRLLRTGEVHHGNA